MKYVLIALMSCLMACQTTQHQTPESSTFEFFDLKKFISEKSKTLDKIPNFKKIITINGESEEKEGPDMDLLDDLEIFSKLDINKSAWLNKYDYEEKTIPVKVRIYRANDPGMKVRVMKIYEDKSNAVTRLEIESQSETMIGSTQQFLSFQPDNGYSILKKDTDLKGKTSEAKVEVLFLK